MMTLNLIPEGDKKELRLFSFYVMLKNIIFVFLIGGSMIASGLLITRLYFQIKFNKLLDENYISSSVSRFSSNEIKKFNKQLNVIEEIQKDYLSWSTALYNFQKIVSDDIIINYFDLNKKNLEVKIRGAAATREGLVNFQNLINSSGYFQGFEVPLETLFEKENINFNFLLKLVDLKIFAVDENDLITTAAKEGAATTTDATDED